VEWYIILGMETTDNYKKHTAKNSVWQLKFFQKALIENYYKYLIKEVKELSPQSILDVGCGEGFTLNKLKENGVASKLEGVDFLHAAVEIGSKVHPDLHLKQGNIYDLPYKDNAFDVVLCTEVLEHLENPEKALKELKRVTKKYCIISVPNEPWFMLGNFFRGKNLSRWGNDIEHINHWTPAGIRKLVGTEFEVLSVHNPLPWTLLLGCK
jgi:2-polyprenyl-3-methyl-5-hydroxy-6-metoxy-1,4-benzoquinol methylase